MTREIGEIRQVDIRAIVTELAAISVNRPRADAPDGSSRLMQASQDELPGSAAQPVMLESRPLSPERPRRTASVTIAQQFEQAAILVVVVDNEARGLVKRSGLSPIAGIREEQRPMRRRTLAPLAIAIPPVQIRHDEIWMQLGDAIKQLDLVRRRKVRDDEHDACHNGFTASTYTLSAAHTIGVRTRLIFRRVSEATTMPLRSGDIRSQSLG